MMQRKNISPRLARAEWLLGFPVRLGHDRIAQMENVEIVATDLRALLFWAAVGVKGSVDGQYSKDIEEIIRSYTEHLGLPNTYVHFKKVKP
jgi:hypothetical protein